ncbi:hypothetical protein M8J77_008230 [Diaphorina citri]|nr:hypothetical protein M8J77_008230 [Diaphorina citri]
MMPLAPTPVMTIPTKPKIGFSIDSIVGSNEKINNNNNECRTGSPKTGSTGANDCSSLKSGEHPMNSPKETYLSRSRSHSRSPSRSPRVIHRSRSPRSPLRRSRSPRSISRSVSPTSRSCSPLDPGRSTPPGVIRPSVLHQPMYLPHHQVHPNHHHHQLALAAAQHFQAANIAAALGGGNSQHQSPNVPPRDTYPLYPWLLSRHGRIFPHRFPGACEPPEFCDCYGCTNRYH